MCFLLFYIYVVYAFYLVRVLDNFATAVVVFILIEGFTNVDVEGYVMLTLCVDGNL